ncbi:MAG: hypothetical protein ACLP3R_00590 [Candidatus Korobacteraceae bacterium]
MSEFRQIEIDFDVHKQIEAIRTSFQEAPNDVLRRVFKLPAGTNSQAPGTQNGSVPKENGPKVAPGRSWSGKGATLPHGK